MWKLKYKAVTKFPQVIRLVHGKAVIQTQAVWLQSPPFQSLYILNTYFFKLIDFIF